MRFRILRLKAREPRGSEGAGLQDFARSRNPKPKPERGRKPRRTARKRWICEGDASKRLARAGGESWREAEQPTSPPALASRSDGGLMAMGCQSEAQGGGSGRGRVAGLGGVGAPTNPDTRPRPGHPRALSPGLLMAMVKEAMDVLWRWDGREYTSR